MKEDCHLFKKGEGDVDQRREFKKKLRLPRFPSHITLVIHSSPQKYILHQLTCSSGLMRLTTKKEEKERGSSMTLNTKKKSFNISSSALAPKA